VRSQCPMSPYHPPPPPKIFERPAVPPLDNPCLSHLVRVLRLFLSSYFLLSRIPDTAPSITSLTLHQSFLGACVPAWFRLNRGRRDRWPFLCKIPVSLVLHKVRRSYCETMLFVVLFILAWPNTVYLFPHFLLQDLILVYGASPPYLFPIDSLWPEITPPNSGQCPLFNLSTSQPFPPHRLGLPTVLGSPPLTVRTPCGFECHGQHFFCSLHGSRVPAWFSSPTFSSSPSFFFFSRV